MWGYIFMQGRPKLRCCPYSRKIQPPPQTFSQKQINFLKNVMFIGTKAVNSIVILKIETFTLLPTNDYGINIRYKIIFIS